jgi:hypothetical protein
MNAYDPALGGDLAVLRYETPEVVILRPGRYVLCAVTGKRIPLDQLRYWSVELQEAYAGPAEALSRLSRLSR